MKTKPFEFSLEQAVRRGYGVTSEVQLTVVSLGESLDWRSVLC